MKYKKTATCLVLFLFLVSMISASTVAKPEVDPLFSLSLIAPTSNPVRMQYSQLMQDEFPKIGIYAELDLISWDALGPRATDTVVGPYDEGGYDIVFFGMSLGVTAPSVSMLVVYHSDALPPNGFNAMYWAPASVGTQYMNERAEENNKAIEDALEQTNITKARELLIEWQKIWYDVMPQTVIYNQYETHAISTGLYGYDPVGYPFTSIEDQWITTDYTGESAKNGTVILAASTGGADFNTHLATDVYDQYTAGPPTDALTGITPSKGVVLPEGTSWDTWMTANYGHTNSMVPYGRCANLGTWDSTFTNYTMVIKDDVYWHDGHELDAWDVSFTYRWLCTPDVGTADYSEAKTAFGTDNRTANYGNYSIIPKDLDGDGEYKTVTFILPKPYGPFERTMTGQTLLPEHILGDPDDHAYQEWVDDAAYAASGWNISGFTNDPSMWDVAPKDQDDHSTNSANPADTGGYPGPIGLGPMVYYHLDTATGNVELRKFDNLMWDGSAWTTTPGISHWNAANLVDMPDVCKVVVTSVDSGLAEMKAGTVNIMDPQFSMGTILRELQAHPAIQAVINVESGWQSIYFNPQFKASTSLGAEDRPLNRKGLRHAVSHIIPRENIINYLLDGLGKPAYTPVPIVSFAFIPEDEMLAYKKTVTAADGSTPESGATTAFDEYNIPLALEWMATEGYDMTPWGGRDGSAVTPTGTTTPTATATKTKTKTKTKTEEPPAAPGFELFMALAVFGVILAIRRKKK
jgi:ABC-type transport system substrate-binding protein